MTSLLGFLVLATIGAGCEFFPPLAEREPADGATVPRSAWLELRFAADVPVESKDLVVLLCDGAPLDLDAHLAAPDLLVLNPMGSLPAGADCVVGLSTVERDELVHFQTAPAAASQLGGRARAAPAGRPVAGAAQVPVPRGEGLQKLFGASRKTI